MNPREFPLPDEPRGRSSAMIDHLEGARLFFVRLAALIRKEALAILADRSSRTILFLPVLMQSLLFGYAATYDLSHVPYAVMDQSHSALSVRLLAHLDGTGFFRRVTDVEAESDIAPVIDSQRALMVITVPRRFEQGLAAGESVPLQVILDARNSTTASTALAHLAAVVGDFNQELARSQGARQPALSLETRAWFNPNRETRWNFMPALIASLSMLQTLLLTALSVAREREQGTFDQLLVTPLSPVQIMLGKSLPPVMIGLIQSTLVFLITVYWFQIPFAGTLPVLYAGLTAFVLAGVGIGLVVSALAATMQQAMLYTLVLLMPMMLLSGLSTPISSMPEILQTATLINPLRYGIDVARRVYLEGAGFGDIAGDLLPLLVIALLTLPMAAWLFRHRLA